MIILSDTDICKVEYLYISTNVAGSIISYLSHTTLYIIIVIKAVVNSIFEWPKPKSINGYYLGTPFIDDVISS